MWKDEIVEEIREYWEAYAAKFNFDLQATYEDLKRAERKSKRKRFHSGPRNQSEWS